MVVAFYIFGILFVLLIARVVFFKGAMHLPVAPPPTGILDMHCHTAGFGAGGSGAWVSDELRSSWKFNLYLKIFGTDMKTVSEQGDQIVMDIIARSLLESVHVDAAVILALDAPYTVDGVLNRAAGEACVPNRFVGETVKAHPELYFGASVHPNRKDALAELEWSKANGAVFVKWLPNIQDINPADERYIDYYKKLVELDLPLLTHVGDEDSFSKTNNTLGDPHLLRLALNCGVRVIAAHVASSGTSDGQDNVERLLEMMPQYPNLVADLSTLTQFNRQSHFPKVLKDARLKGRLMYGTDYPLTNTPLVSPLQYFLRLSLTQLWQLMRTRNSWDRDVRLKAALGVPPEVFSFSREFLNIKG
ncbi:MAG: amidohydrolase family protein [Opitutaceae bacterium]